jgi:hypothetical protein
MEATLPPGTYGALVHSKVFVKREIYTTPLLVLLNRFSILMVSQLNSLY